MRPPICAICGNRFEPSTDGGLVSFLLTDDQKKSIHALNNRDLQGIQRDRIGFVKIISQQHNQFLTYMIVKH